MKIFKSQIRDIKEAGGLTVVEPVNLYECQFGQNCFVGPFVEVQKNVIIGDNTRIQSHTFICELVEIGSRCFIGHGVMFINDLFRNLKPSGDKKLWEKTHISDDVSIGSNATILPVYICEHVVIGAGSVVTKDIRDAGIYVGNPAIKIKDI